MGEGNEAIHTAGGKVPCTWSTWQDKAMNRGSRENCQVFTCLHSHASGLFIFTRGKESNENLRAICSKGF